MDTTDPLIEFNAEGVCNHCRGYDRVVSTGYYTGQNGINLDSIVTQIKRQGAGKPYDCIIGVSGGVDSTYTANLTHELGLRPLAVHLDNGWNSEMAVHNIENTLNKLGIELYTHVLDWDEFRDLQVAFLKASTPDAEIPTDHAITNILYELAAKHGIHHVLLGNNTATEGILPLMWSYGYRDWRYIKSVHDRYGSVKLKNFHHYDLPRLAWYQMVKGISIVRVLDYVNYTRQDALETIQVKLGWKNYGWKHYESIYTRFFHGYILPRKFNIDKRRAHLSALICSGQTTRIEALQELEKDPYTSPELMAEDREYVIKKLRLTPAGFQEIMEATPRCFLDYPNNYHLLQRIIHWRNRLQGRAL
jgi:N-acetyl sugar amidotransferase